MKFATINTFDVANGPGIRVSLFVTGCNFHCKGCFNEKAQDFNYGKEFTEEYENIILERLKHPDFAGLSLLGGDPLWQSKEDMKKLITLCEKVHLMGKTVWLWTGFSWDEIINGKDDESFVRRCLVKNCDYVVEGRFELDKRNLGIAWRGSSNQTIIKVEDAFKA